MLNLCIQKPFNSTLCEWLVYSQWFLFSLWRLIFSHLLWGSLLKMVTQRLWRNWYQLELSSTTRTRYENCSQLESLTIILSSAFQRINLWPSKTGGQRSLRVLRVGGEQGNIMYIFVLLYRHSRSEIWLVNKRISIVLTLFLWKMKARKCN